MAALLLRQIVGIWQVAQTGDLPNRGAPDDNDPASAVEKQLMAAVEHQAHLPTDRQDPREPRPS
eukprot:5548359-Prorocentrum_lima.AAC.1